LHLQKAGQYDAARENLEQALAIWQKTRGAGHPDTALALSSLENLFKDAGDYRRARECLEQALAVRQKADSPDGLPAAQSPHDLGALLRKAGEPAAARQRLGQAYAARRKALGPRDAQTQASRFELCQAMLDQVAALRKVGKRDAALAAARRL